MFGFLAQLLSWCYGVWPNYAAMILLFTLIIMVVVTPFTIKGMRSAAEMARIQPEMKKLQDQYKNDRIKQNEEMQALFKEHGVNPLGGCLPTLLPLPIFFIIFRLLERMNARKSGALAPIVRLIRNQVSGAPGYVQPHYLSYKATLTQAIIHSNGQLKAFGFDLALAARNHHPSVGSAIPYWVLIAVMTASQYWQQHQINQRNPAAANANPQMKMTMQLFPAFYAIISINIPAAVVFYLLISGLFRMAQNTLSYRFDPVLARSAASLKNPETIEAVSRPKAGASTKAALSSGKTPAGSKGSPRPRTPSKSVEPAEPTQTFMGRLRQQAADAKAQANQAKSAPAKPAAGTESGTGANGNGARKTSSGPSGGTAKGTGGAKRPASAKTTPLAKGTSSTTKAAGGTAKATSGTAKATPPARKPTRTSAAIPVPVPEAAGVDGPDDPVEIEEPTGIIEASVVDDSYGADEPVEADDSFESGASAGADDGFEADEASDADDDAAETASVTPQSNGGATPRPSPLSVRRAAPRPTKRPKDR